MAHLFLHPGATRGFAQTFVLSPQAGGFFVLTDVLRLMSAVPAVSPHAPALKPAAAGAMTPAATGDMSRPESSSPVTPPQDVVTAAHDEAGTNTETSSPDASESGRQLPVPMPMPIAVPWNASGAEDPMPNSSPEASSLSGRASWPQVGFSQPYGAALAQATTAPGSSGGSDGGEAPKPVAPATESASIFVRRLPVDVTHADLMEAFSVFGVVRSCVVKTAATRAFAFIDFDTPAAAAAALAARVAIGGALVTVEEKRERNQRPSSGFSPNLAMRGIGGYPSNSRSGGRSRAGTGGPRMHLGGLMTAPGYGGHQLMWPMSAYGGDGSNMWQQYSPQQFAMDQLMAAQHGGMMPGGMIPGYPFLQQHQAGGGEHVNSSAHLVMGGGYSYAGGGGGAEEAYHITRGAGGEQGGEGGGGAAEQGREASGGDLE